MKKSRLKLRALSIFLTAGLLFTYSSSVFAAPPSVTTDETVYANLDYYGSLSGISIVKSCSLNGNTSFVDYGNYEKVSNMSTLEEPELSEDHVSFHLEESRERFYYECTPKNENLSLPWNFDISYKLNGVPKRAEELAGASGLVEILVHAMPNEHTKNYYKNNMLLFCTMLVDTQDTYSFEAEGAQMQSLGSKKMALYMATPNQDITFSFKIGSDAFETPGVILLMAPASLSQLDEVKNIRKAQQTVEDAAKAIDRSLDSMINTLEGTRGGLNSLKGGISQLDQAREGISSDMDTVYNQADQVTEESQKLHEAIDALSSAADAADIDLSEVEQDLGELGDNLLRVKRNLRDLEKSLNKIQEILNSLKSKSMTEQEAQEQLTRESETLTRILDQLREDGVLDTISKKLKELSDLLPDLPLSGENTALDQLRIRITDVLNELSGISKSVSGISEHAGDALNNLINITWDLEQVGETLNEVTDSTKELLRQVDPFLSSVRIFSDSVENTLKGNRTLLNGGTSQTLKGIQSLLSQATSGLSQLDSLKDDKQVIKDTIENEWEKLDQDLGLLDIDTSAERVSFTSEKNSEPASLQILLRSQEITEASIKDIVDLETPDEDIGILNRIKNIFIKIWDSITGLFS